MERLTVSFHLKKDGRLIYIEDVISQEIMTTCSSLLALKSFYCQEKGYKSSNLESWTIHEPEGD